MPFPLFPFEAWRRSRAVLVALLLAGVGHGPGAHAAEPRGWNMESGARWRELEPGVGRVGGGFTRLDPETTGVRFTNELRGDLSLTNAVAHNGSGVALGDVDGDQLPDLYFCALDGPNRLYRNRGGWVFEEIPLTEAACVGQRSTGAVFADVDGDADLDLLVNGIATGTRLFLNDGRGGLKEATDTGLSRTASATSLALADIDGDGDLDLYCTHYVDVMYLADPTTRFAVAREGSAWRVTRVNGESTSLPKWKDRFEALPDGRVRELPEYHGLYRNEGSGRFTPILFEPGVFLSAEGQPIAPYRDWGLSVMFRDLNGDRAPDLYVCNDNASPDRIWLNTGRGSFRAAEPWRFRHTSRSSMGLDVADVDRDGRDDLVVLDMLARSAARRQRQLMRESPDPAGIERAEDVPRFNRNTLFLGRADGSYAEVALWAGVAASDWSWGAAFLDVDLDGYEDLLVTNGFEHDVMDQDSHDQMRTRRLTPDQRRRLRQFHPAWPTPNAAWRNRGDGTFEDRGAAWGFDTPGISYGLALADLDGDGDQDVVVNQLNGAAGVYRNDAPGPRVAVRLAGRAPNTAGIGARLVVKGGPVTQSQEMISGGRYLSGDQAIRVFAARTAGQESLRLEVTWRGGARSEHPLRPGTLCEAIEPEVKVVPNVTNALAVEVGDAWFRDQRVQLDHRHEEDGFDDTAVQPLLPRRLSRLGPGVAWVDLDGDGWEDLVVGSGKGGSVSTRLNQAGAGFRAGATSGPVTADLSGVVGWPDGRGARFVIAARGIGDLVPGRESRSALVRWAPGSSIQKGAWPEGIAVEGDPVAPGPVALGDFDGDGDLDVFVGGRHRPGRHPESVSSVLWRNDGGEWVRDPLLNQPFQALGRISGAVWADWDADGDADLAMAQEGGALKVFRNTAGKFEDVTAALGLGDHTGWWNSITVGDFDGDGRVDLAAGNWGLNSAYELYRPGPWRWYFADAQSDGVVEVVEAWREEGVWRPMRSRSWLARGFPDLAQRFPTHAAFAGATVEEVLGAGGGQIPFLEVNRWESAVFLNRGTRFEFRPLPREAQWSPVFGMSVADFDGDGVEDLFLGQNFFGSTWDVSRDDAGRGLWLRGRGDGTFEVAETGVTITGEMRGVAVADYDHDARPDLVVTQNGGATVLMQNQRAAVGIRVRLEGGVGNPEGVGAVARWVAADGRRGPVRVFHAGAGYWSQDASVRVLSSPPGPGASIWVRWPGGREEVVALKPGQREVSLRTPEGKP
ncbi:MAG: VCBS repeat-containing protein [Verrucomicrobiales bacterium]|nr:VCBS repeat-containing protein [Verrucomicrobiales bacterium]